MKNKIVIAALLCLLLLGLAVRRWQRNTAQCVMDP